MTSNWVARFSSTVGGGLAIAPVTVSTSKDGMTIHFFFIFSSECGTRVLIFGGHIRNDYFINEATKWNKNSTTVAR
jgi:hypothetical protein